jgi:hypothetical protein
MDHAPLDLPDVDAMLARMTAAAAAELRVILEGAMLSTWAAVDGEHSLGGRRRWLTAWRAWLDVLELKGESGGPLRDGCTLIQAALDVVERQSERQFSGPITS